MANSATGTYRDLVAWQKGMTLAQSVYAFSRTLPTQERFGLRAQMERSAVSVPCNLAEGHSRRTRAAYAHHVSIALGSQGELETLLELTARLGLGEDSLREQAAVCAKEVGRVMYGLYRRLNESRERRLLY